MNKGTYRLLALGILPIVALLVIIGAAGAAPKGGLTVDLKVAQSEFRASQDVLVTVTLSNRTKQPARILKWLTPADGVDASLFTVTRDGQPVAYTGAQVKRPAATDSDYLGSSPARASATWSTSATSTTSRGRAATRSPTTSRPTISSTRRARRRRARTRLRPTRSASRRQGARARASRRRLRRLQVPARTPSMRAPPRNSQRSAPRRTQAKAYAANAATYLGHGHAGASVHDVVRRLRVHALQHRHLAFQRHFLGDAERRHRLRLQQQENVYAYVYPNQPYKIYLGRVYWTAPAAGTDSQAGTLIHEMSHFDQRCGHR